MLTIKSKREIELMKKAGSIVELALENVHKAIKPGVSTLELDRIAYKTIIENDAIPSFLNYNNLREVDVNGIRLIFIYEYCLSEVQLLNLMPKENDVIVNLHGWNGKSCISNQAYQLSKKMKVTLLTMEDFYIYIHEIKK